MNITLSHDNNALLRRGVSENKICLFLPALPFLIYSGQCFTWIHCQKWLLGLAAVRIIAVLPVLPRCPNVVIWEQTESAFALQGVKLQLFWHVLARRRNPGKYQQPTLNNATAIHRLKVRGFFSDSDLIPGCHGLKIRVGELSLLHKLLESLLGCSCCTTEQNGRLGNDSTNPSKRSIKRRHCIWAAETW